MNVVLAFEAPYIDYHAFAPEIVLVTTFVALVVVDVISERNRVYASAIAGVGLLAATVPILTLAVAGGDRSMFGGAYEVDGFALVLKALFVVSGYVVVLMSTNYIAGGDYWEGEYYQLLVAAIIGMTVMASARDLITIFVALELLSIPAYMLAAWRKRDPRSNEAGLKYYLMGVFASAVMLYGMSLVFGITGTTVLADIAVALNERDLTGEPIIALGVVFVIVGFGFKVSAVPFHTWAPDTYEGAPTPITAFLSVASKAAGFVALLQLVFVAFFGASNIYQPLFWILAALTMTVGNLAALGQTNIVRLFAYSSVAQAGFMIAPLAVAGESLAARDLAISAVVVYLVIYAAMNLGAFAMIIAVARKTKSGEVSSYAGLFQYAPGLTVVMTVFLFSLAGIPPLAGWFAKFVIFRALVTPGSVPGYVLALLVGVNSVVALFYYARIAQQMWMQPAPEGVGEGPGAGIRVPVALTAALVICVVVTLVLGVAPGLVGRLGELAQLVVPS
ncbi:MAG: NADH-quinone oxidoreductase subunit N [Acidimicrobiales bacterium]